MGSKTTIVVIGASFAGVATAHSILKEIPNVKVVLINPTEKFYFNIAAPRILAKPSAFRSEQYLLSIKDEFSRHPESSFTFIQGSASDIDAAAKLVTVNGAAIHYDYLVIASGSSTPSTAGHNSDIIPFKPTGMSNIEASIKAAQEKIAGAKRIIIAGAGPVGVEFAGELADAFAKYDDRTITLISGTAKILPSLKDAAGHVAENLLAAQNVKVIKGHKVETAVRDGTSGDWRITLTNGEQISGDVYISTIGVTPNNSFIPSEFLSNTGWVQVDEEFRVQSTSGNGGKKISLPIFAVGDITVYPGRLAMNVANQVPVLVANLKVDILGRGKPRTYMPQEKMAMIVPVGQSSGTGEMFGWVPWGKLVKMIKGKDFFVSKARGFHSSK